jgi:hypothetical protein
MAPKRKRQSVVALIIPPIDPNSQLPFSGNHMSIISESNLFTLLRLGFTAERTVFLWIWHGVTVPTEDTHESVVYVSFLIRGLALPISPFFAISSIFTI